MTEDDWKQLHANAADETLKHPLVQDVMAELRGNLGVSDDGLPAYGIAKVAHYAAQVARAQALGFDPDLLRMTPEEADSAQLQIAAAAVLAGVPVTMIPTPTADETETLCSWCDKPIRKGIATVRRPLAEPWGVETYHAECWDQKLRAEQRVYLHYRPTDSSVTLCGRVHSSHQTNGTRYVDCPDCLAHPDFPAK